MQENRTVLSANLVLDTDSEVLLNRMAHKIFDSARAGTLALPGFPCFDQIIAALRADDKSEDQKGYQVCHSVNGSLKILEAFVQKWLETEQTQERALALVQAHDGKYNEDGDMIPAARTV